MKKINKYNKKLNIISINNNIQNDDDDDPGERYKKMQEWADTDSCRPLCKSQPMRVKQY
jgi:hypothetical protein